VKLPRPYRQGEATGLLTALLPSRSISPGLWSAPSRRSLHCASRAGASQAELCGYAACRTHLPRGSLSGPGRRDKFLKQPRLCVPACTVFPLLPSKMTQTTRLSLSLSAGRKEGDYFLHPRRASQAQVARAQCPAPRRPPTMPSRSSVCSPSLPQARRATDSTSSLLSPPQRRATFMSPDRRGSLLSECFAPPPISAVEV
jgi:hypothetical protein